MAIILDRESMSQRIIALLVGEARAIVLLTFAMGTGPGYIGSIIDEQSKAVAMHKNNRMAFVPRARVVCAPEVNGLRDPQARLGTGSRILFGSVWSLC